MKTKFQTSKVLQTAPETPKNLFQIRIKHNTLKLLTVSIFS